jgi:GH25 family lysozyme M1 (1,4-beta-N-acetylmuramidase)
MKTPILSLLVAAGVAQASVQGFDISNYQGNVNFAGAYASGARFVMIKVSFRMRHPCRS